MGQIPIPERAIEPRAEDLYDVESKTSPQRVAYPLSEIVYEIIKEARAAGFKAPLFNIVSGYRSVAEQEILYANALKKYGSAAAAAPFVAKPGSSSHHTGYTVDFYLGYPTNSEYVPEIKKTKAYKFLAQIAPKYGLWQLPSEPWHWELDREARENYIRQKDALSLQTDIDSVLADSGPSSTPVSRMFTTEDGKEAVKKKGMSTGAKIGISFLAASVIVLGVIYVKTKNEEEA